MTGIHPIRMVVNAVFYNFKFVKIELDVLSCVVLYYYQRF